MRDGSLDDVVSAGIERVVEDYRGSSLYVSEAAIYFAVLRKGAIGLLTTYDHTGSDPEIVKAIAEILSLVRDRLDPSAGIERHEPQGLKAEYEKSAAPARTVAVPPGRKHARYWEGDAWRRDFYTSFSQWFWDMKYYAVPAGRKKKEFLWDVGELWIAAGAAALVYYAEDNRLFRSSVADMMRNLANSIEEDGLRSPAWGRGR